MRYLSINILLQKGIAHIGKGFVDSSLIASDIPYRIANKGYSIADLSEGNIYRLEKMHSDTDKNLSHAKVPYLTGAYLGFTANVAGRLILASQFENPVAKVVSFFSPEIATGITRLVKSIGEKVYVHYKYLK